MAASYADAAPADMVPLRAEDALFLHAQNARLCQQVGTILLLDTDLLSVADFRAEITRRVRGVAALRRRLQPPASRWRRPRWITENDVEVSQRIDAITLGPDSTDQSLREAADAFFSLPTDPWRAPWAMLFVRGLPGRRAAIMVKVHHTLGGSQAIIAALTQLFDEPPSSSAPARAAQHGAPLPHRRVQETARTVKGLWHLAKAGRAPATSLCGRSTSERRRYLPLALAARDVAITARNLKAGIAELLLAVIAEAIGRLLRSRGETTAGRVVRVAVPRAQTPPTGGRQTQPSNRSAVVSVDLPIGPLCPAERLNAISRQFQAHLRQGEPGAAAFVLRAMNVLPPPLQRLSAVLVYHHRWFNLLVSIFPGVRGQYHLLGVPVAEVYPVLALADGVGLAIAAGDTARGPFPEVWREGVHRPASSYPADRTANRGRTVWPVQVPPCGERGTGLTVEGRRDHVDGPWWRSTEHSRTVSPRWPGCSKTRTRTMWSWAG